MFKPFWSRKYNPEAKDESNDWLLWRWFDITSQQDQHDGFTGQVPVYLRRLYLVRTPLFSIMVHRILRPDPDRHVHDHPWDFLSILLRGRYSELRNNRIRIRQWFNFCRAEGAHRITHVSDNCLTLVITGPKRRSWGFHTEDGWVGWRDYIYG